MDLTTNFIIVGEAIVLERYGDIDIVQNDLNNIMHHLYIGTEFLDLNKGIPYSDSEFNAE